MLNYCRVVVLAAFMGCCAVPVMGAEGGEMFPGAPGQPVGLPGPSAGPVGLPGAPVAQPIPALLPAGTQPFGLPGAMPEAPSLPSLPLADAPVTPTLSNLVAALEATTATDVSAAEGAAPSGEIPLYSFLFREMDDGTVRREKYPQPVAETEVVRNEIDRLTLRFAGNAQQGVDPRAGAIFDFYFYQLELYYRYIRDSVLVGVETVDEPTYSAENFAQEQVDLKNSYDQLAQFIVNKQYNENLEFYDRLQQREDRRRAFYEWLAAAHRRVDEQAVDWGRNVNGALWPAGELPTNTADWYYGVNFAAEGGVAVTIDGITYLLSREPLRRVPRDQVNVTSTNLSPYDIINRDGAMKTAESERARRAPGAAAGAGTIRIVP